VPIEFFDDPAHASGLPTAITRQTGHRRLRPVQVIGAITEGGRRGRLEVVGSSKRLGCESGPSVVVGGLALLLHHGGRVVMTAIGIEFVDILLG
jgi:hypothetical protein